MRWGRSLILTVLLFALIMLASFAVMNHITRMERERCFARLYQEAGDIATFIEQRIHNDCKQLKVLSAVIATYSDFSSPELWQLLDSLQSLGMMSRVELLLPGDRLITSDGHMVDAEGKLSFEKEAELDIHISDRERDLLDPESYVLRHYVPVMQQGKIAALLCGVVVLKDLPIEVGITPYSGLGSLFIVDARTGDFLLDSWHPGRVGNIWALGERKTAPGYNGPQLMQDMMAGKRGYIIFVSRTIGEYLYYYYEPLDVNEWRLAISVPESIVFESSNTSQKVLHAFIAFEFVCFCLYLLWMLRTVRRVTSEKQRRLDLMQQVNLTERLLFNAHEKKENLYAALEQIGTASAAKSLYFWLLGNGEADAMYGWEKGRQARELEQRRPYLEDCAGLLDFFATGHELYTSYAPVHDSYVVLPFKLRQLAAIVHAVPIRDVVDGEIRGILALCGVSWAKTQSELLRALTFSLGMFCNNMKNRVRLQEQGDQDTLTGLYNRNRYERDLQKIYAQHQDALACVYIDVNGLRETNNTRGHDLGDRMLRAVAAAIKEHFATPYRYRTGGDEFVLFVPGGQEKELTASSAALSAALAAQDYHVSIGIQCATALSSVSALIKEAEQKMYAQKRQFYAQLPDRRRS